MFGKPELYLDGAELPAPAENGISITRHKIWSSNAGRNSATGDFKGDLISMKYTVALTYENLSESEMQIFRELAVSTQPFHILEFTLHDEKRRIQCYVPEPELKVFRWNPQTHQTRYDSFTIEFIEK